MAVFARALRRGTIVALIALALASSPAHADARADITARLGQWAADFNAGHADRVCDLFAEELVADIQGGAPGRTFDEQCTLLKRALADKSKTFTYAPVIHEITVLGDTAIVRLDWTLTTKLTMRPEAIASTEVGMDVFRRQPDGQWRIVRFIAFDAQ